MLLGYTKWERFQNAIDRAKEACKNAGGIVDDHFPGAGKMIHLAKGAVREVGDYMLTRYACYLALSSQTVLLGRNCENAAKMILWLCPVILYSYGNAAKSEPTEIA